MKLERIWQVTQILGHMTWLLSTREKRGDVLK